MIDEQTLVEQTRNGNMNAFRQLVERYQVKIYRLAYDLSGNHLDAQDVSQDVFLKAYKSLHNFRGDSKFGTWLYRITVNTCYDHRSKKSLTMFKPTHLTDDDENSIPVEPRSTSVTPEQSAEASLIQKDIERALEQLTPREKIVFTLRHYHDLPLKEIADMLEISLGSVKTLLFRAIRRLQSELSIYREELGIE
ncbi:MAG: sigma-70 family RNA polymerase sigma factor [Ignavibacteriae bacterium]|nr:sigma-70 family RNA polymerase sigma factor [Ignavibacteriota bacterium]